jgi:toxin ParE1/3/4
MTSLVRRTDRALQDLNELAEFIQRDSPDTAIRFLGAAEDTFQRLAMMPDLGQRQAFGRPRLADLRAWQVRGFKNYVIFYRPVAHGIEVVRVLHAARDIGAIFDDEA